MQYNRKQNRSSLKDLKLQLLITESEKQVAIHKLQSEKSRVNVSDFTSILQSKNTDETKRRQKAGKLLIELLSLIDSNSSLQFLLEMGQLETYTKVFDQGKCYKLLKKLIKPFTLLIKHLLNTNLTDNVNQSLQSTRWDNTNERVQQLNQAQHHQSQQSMPSVFNKFNSQSAIIPSSENGTPSQAQHIFQLQSKQTQTHNDPMTKKPSELLNNVPKFKRPQRITTYNIISNEQISQQ